MNRTVLAIVAAALAAFPFVQGPDLATRVDALEKRVATIEHALTPAPTAAWTQAGLYWLFLAASELQRDALPLARDEDGRARLQAIMDAAAAVSEARDQMLRGNSKLAARIATDALETYNAVARSLGKPERTADSPKPATRADGGESKK